jgi:hypothetical protein
MEPALCFPVGFFSYSISYDSRIQAQMGFKLDMSTYNTHMRNWRLCNTSVSHSTEVTHEVIIIKLLKKNLSYGFQRSTSFLSNDSKKMNVLIGVLIKQLYEAGLLIQVLI